MDSSINCYKTCYRLFNSCNKDTNNYFLIKPPFVHHHDVHYIVGLTSASAHLAWKWLPWLSKEVAKSVKSNKLSHNHQKPSKI